MWYFNSENQQETIPKWKKKTPVESPWNAEEVVQSDAQFFHAGLLKAQRDRQDEAAAPVLSSYRRDI